MFKRQFFLFLFAGLLSCIAGWAGTGITFSNQWPFFEALRTTASIVFAVMGAWVTILYPKALESVIHRSAMAPASDHEDRIAALMLPLKLSTAVVVVVLMLGPLALYLKQLSLIVGYLHIFRGLSFGLLVFLTLAEMGAVLLTLWPIEAAKGEVSAAHEKKKQRASLFRLVQHR